MKTYMIPLTINVEAKDLLELENTPEVWPLLGAEEKTQITVTDDNDAVLTATKYHPSEKW